MPSPDPSGMSASDASTPRRRPPAPLRVLRVLLALPLALARVLSSAAIGRRQRSGRLPASGADRAIVLATLAAIVLVGAATVAVMRSTPAEEDLAFDAPTLVTADVVTTSPTTSPPAQTLPTTAPPPQPAAAPRTQPIAPPADPRAKEPIVQIGEIRIPKIGLVHPIYEGVTLTVIDQGPGHWPSSARPGQLGNAVLAGHRVTKTRPFRNIDQLVAGDEIIFTTSDGTFTYQMTRQEIVSPKDVWIVDPTPDATVTLSPAIPRAAPANASWSAAPSPPRPRPEQMGPRQTVAPPEPRGARRSAASQLLAAAAPRRRGGRSLPDRTVARKGSVARRHPGSPRHALCGHTFSGMRRVAAVSSWPGWQRRPAPRRPPPTPPRPEPSRRHMSSPPHLRPRQSHPRRPRRPQRCRPPPDRPRWWRPPRRRPPPPGPPPRPLMPCGRAPRIRLASWSPTVPACSTSETPSCPSCRLRP